MQKSHSGLQENKAAEANNLLGFLSKSERGGDLLTIEEYIAKRKKEENMDEFDLAERQNNIRLCVDFVFEYFNSYLDAPEEEVKTVPGREKSAVYQSQLKKYESRVLQWLEDYYAE